MSPIFFEISLLKKSDLAVSKLHLYKVEMK